MNLMQLPDELNYKRQDPENEKLKITKSQFSKIFVCPKNRSVA